MLDKIKKLISSYYKEKPMLTKEDLEIILACLDSKEYNVEGRLDPRVPVVDGKSTMLLPDMLDRISEIKRIVHKQIEEIEKDQ
jgi:hypothetical protein